MAPLQRLLFRASLRSQTPDSETIISPKQPSTVAIVHGPSDMAKTLSMHYYLSLIGRRKLTTVAQCQNPLTYEAHRDTAGLVLAIGNAVPLLDINFSACLFGVECL